MDNPPFGAVAVRQNANTIIGRLRILEEVILNSTTLQWIQVGLGITTALPLDMLRGFTYPERSFSSHAQMIAATIRLLIEIINDFVDKAPWGTLVGPPRPTILSNNELGDEEQAPSPITVSTTFPQFTKLPHELKLMVLEAACLPIACPLYLRRLVPDSRLVVHRELVASALMPDRGLWNASALTRKVIKRMYIKNLKRNPASLLVTPIGREIDAMDIHHARAFTVSLIGRHIQDNIRELQETFNETYSLRIPMRPWEFDHVFTLDDETFRFDQLGNCWVNGDHMPFGFDISIIQSSQLLIGSPRQPRPLSPPQNFDSQPEGTATSEQNLTTSDLQSSADALETSTTEGYSLSTSIESPFQS